MDPYASVPARVGLVAPEVHTIQGVAQVRGRHRLRRLLPGLMVPLCCSLLPGATPPPTDPARQVDEGVIELAAVEVTGSLIKRAEAETAVPVKVIARSDIESSGHASFGEYLQQLPEAGYSSNHENAPVVGSAYRGMSVLNLRGFDPANTLVLVDGRRPVSSGIGWNGTMFTDLNRFHTGLVERVEILQDCGTIYGSGGAAGVVNILLRQDEAGGEVTARYGNAADTDAAEKSLSVLVGTRQGRTGLTVGASYSARSALRAADTAFANNADLTDRYAAKGAAYAARAAAGTFDLRNLPGPQARVWLAPGQVNGVGGVNVPGLAPGQAITRLPGTTVSPANASANAVTPSFIAPALLGTGGQFDAAAAATFVPQNLTRHTAPSNLYNQNEAFWLTSRYERWGIDLSLRHTLSPHATAYACLGYQHNGNYIESPAEAVDSVWVPRTNYWNPFGVDVLVSWRPVELGPRTSTVVDETQTALLGARGTLAGRWQWDTACSYGYDRNTETLRNYTSRAGWEVAIARSAPDAVNVFGGAGYRNPAAVMAPLRAYWDVQGKARAVAWDARASGDLVALPMGLCRGGLLVEARREEFGDYPMMVDTFATLLSPPLDFSAPGSDRSIGSVAAELQAPLIKRDTTAWLYASELSVAARSDHYSDGFDSGVNPYYGLRVQLARWLTLRTSLARTFRAPTLPQIHGGTSDQTGYWADLRRPFALTGDPFDTTITPRVYRFERNPDLQPCESQVWQYGFVLDLPGRALKGLTLGFTYSELEETGTIVHGSSQFPFILSNEVGGGTADFFVREPGTETYVNRTNAPVAVLSGPDGATTAVAPGGPPPCPAASARCA